MKNPSKLKNGNFYKNTFNKWSDAFLDKSIVELAAHDGLLGCQAMMAGGKHLKITDIRQENLDNYKEHYPHIELQTEIVDVTNSQQVLNSLRNIDTVIYMGHLNHTAYHRNILDTLNSSDVKNIIIGSRFPLDSQFHKLVSNLQIGIMIWHNEEIYKSHMAKNETYVGIPNFAWLDNLIRQIGWKIVDYQRTLIKSSYNDYLCDTFLFYCKK